jgi:hypothetical protein
MKDTQIEGERKQDKGNEANPQQGGTHRSRITQFAPRSRPADDRTRVVSVEQR